MLKLPKKMLFAIEAVVDIAYHAGSQPVQSQDITRRQGIPRRYLEQALQKLVRAEILTGLRGPRGGYNLARERRRISIGDIVHVMRNTNQADDPLENKNGSELTLSVIRPIWQNIEANVMTNLNDISIDNLCQQAQESGVVSEGRKSLDFTI
jgi:Rrf2 family transcriptional regulator, iron-sulfur cluster assembly transcription factor